MEYQGKADRGRRLHQQRSQEMFVPLAHAPGTAQADFGEALVVMGRS
jgi:hypothetical protein